ncbi:MAG: hypothetical protein C0475_02095 [Planctomyces sp.]|nr:hypothetical protein [Planctomyces sp.]MBA4038889.1 hypothetical protein [Planctomyces sp.]MBA4119847.1 hypothetical protein [Isosphaera sp.]
MKRLRSDRDLNQLRAWRTRGEPDLTLKLPLARMSKEIRQQAGTLGRLTPAWIALVPAEARARATLVSLARGVLTVRCHDAAVRFELDRWLRGGGEMDLVRAVPSGLLRVRLV